jgi:hypothetical protein
MSREGGTRCESTRKSKFVYATVSGRLINNIIIYFNNYLFELITEVQTIIINTNK